MVAAQPYGGELLLRVALLTLPVSTILIATTLIGEGTGERRDLRTPIAVSAVLALAIPLFVLARFGNESFEFVTDDDLAVTEALYDVAPDGTVVYVPQPPDARQHRSCGRGPVPDHLGAGGRGGCGGRTATRSAQRSQRVRTAHRDPDAAGVENDSRPSGWTLDYADELLAFDGVVEVVRVGGAVLLEVRVDPPSAEASRPAEADPFRGVDVEVAER